MTIDLRFFLRFLPLAVLPFVAHGQGLEYDWYRGGAVTPPDNATYNGQPQSIVKFAKLDGVDIGGIDEEYADSNGTPLPGRPSEVGSYTATVIFPPATGLGNLIGQTFTIQQDTLTVAANSKSRQYGLSNPTLDYQISGFQGSDSSGVISGSPVVTTTATLGSNVGSYGISVDVSGMSSPNYAFSGSGNSLSVTQAPLAIQANSHSRSHGEANPPFTFSASGFRNGDTTAVLAGDPSYSTTATAGSTSGNYPILISQGSLAATNYSLTFSNSTSTLTINKLVQSLSGLKSPLTLEYGAVNSELPATTSAGLPITYTLAPGSSSGVVSVSGNTLTASGVGSVNLVASQFGNNIYFPLQDAHISVTVVQATFDMSDYPHFNNVRLDEGKDFKITDYLVRQTTIPVTITPVFGVSEGIVSDNFDGTLKMWSEGPVVLRVDYDDPAGNYKPSYTHRAIEILKDGVDAGTDPVASTEPPDVPSAPPGYSPPLDEGVPVGDNWYYLDWFGFYYWDADQHREYIYHYKHGWLYVPDPYLSTTPIWMYSFAKQFDEVTSTYSGLPMGWLFTQDDNYRYPYMAWHSGAGQPTIWFSQIDEQDGSQVFFNYAIDPDNPARLTGFINVK